tara:strand:- start:560 stop:1858 length:1299 start_codon:yes stop_codon:yes gene_type:complete
MGEVQMKSVGELCDEIKSLRAENKELNETILARDEEIGDIEENVFPGYDDDIKELKEENKSLKAELSSTKNTLTVVLGNLEGAEEELEELREKYVAEPVEQEAFVAEFVEQEVVAFLEEPAIGAGIVPAEMPYSLNEILTCKSIDLAVVWRDYRLLVKFDAETNPRKFVGNKTIYQYQFAELLKCRRGSKNYKTIEEWFADPELKEKLWKDAIHRNRRDKALYPNPSDVYECHRINNGAIVPFKASTAKYIYKKFNATSVLDPTMGWGGRMLGATSLGINYIGFDTNTDLRPGYEKMIQGLCDCPIFFREEDIQLFWESSLNEDIISTLDYDMVLTSPPYEEKDNYMEVYSHMTPWQSEEQFYTEFLIPLIDLCHKYLKDGGKSCWNISPKMYKKLTKKYNYPECDSQEDLRQQLGQQYKTKSQDYIYIWTK